MTRASNSHPTMSLKWLLIFVAAMIVRGDKNFVGKKLTDEQYDMIQDAFRMAGEVLAKGATEDPQGGRVGRGERRLDSERACNAKMDSLTQDDMTTIAGTFLGALIPDPDLLAVAQQFLLGLVEYDVDVYKICGSCTDLSPTSADASTDPNELGSFESYCTDYHGDDATHSAIVFVPVMSGAVVMGHLRAYMHFRTAQISVEDGPTDGWNVNLVADLAAAGANPAAILAQLPFVIDYLPQIMTAAGGAVAMGPDYIGYGASLPTSNRAFLQRESYMQAAGVTWLQTQKWLSEYTSGCTSLQDVATLGGNSEGGFGVMAGAKALRSLGVRLIMVFSGAGPYNPEGQVVHMVQQYQPGSTLSPEQFAFRNYPVLIAYTVASYSFENEGIANTGSGQLAVSSAWNVEGNFTRNVVDWFESPEPLTAQEINMMVPEYPPEVVNEDLMSLINNATLAGVSSPCSSSFVEEGVTDKLCEAMLDATAVPIVLEVDHPTTLCFGENDTGIPPHVHLSSDFFNNDLITNYTGLQGNAISGDHFQIVTQCTLAPLTFFAIGADPADKPNEVAPLEGEVRNQCLGITPTDPPPTTNKPTQSPVAAPSDKSSSSVISVGTSLGILGMALLFSFF